MVEQSLLLLPSPPTPANSVSLTAAYRPPLLATLSILKEQARNTTLIIAVPWTSLDGRRGDLPRSQIYNEAQSLLSGLYSLVCRVCAKLELDVDPDLPGAVDARILLLEYRPLKQVSSQDLSQDTPSPGIFLDAGPIIDLPTLALSRRGWSQVFSVEGEPGQTLKGDYVRFATKTNPLQAKFLMVGGGISLVQYKTSAPILPNSSGFFLSHSVVIVGGTFDHLHAGHKLLLTVTAFLLQPVSSNSHVHRRLIVGITGDELLRNKKYAEYLKSWKQRQNDVVEFLLSILSFSLSASGDAIQTLSFDSDSSTSGRVVHTILKECSITIECVEIHDPFGPTITDESVTALVVSGETRAGGQAVNEKRVEKGWKALEVYEVDVLDAEETEVGTSKTSNFESKISSTALRKHQADRARISSL